MNTGQNEETFITSRSVKLTKSLDTWVKIHKATTNKPISDIYFEALQLYKDKQEQQQSPSY